MRFDLRVAAALWLFTLPAAAQVADAPNDPLASGFQSPPEAARPRVCWHWMNGNVTEHGIHADLEWMQRVGLGGMQNFDAATETPRLVNPPVTYMTAPWKQAFRYSAENADRLGLELSIAGSPGWSESGGPWVVPQAAMKKLVWSAVQINGGRALSGPLPSPAKTTGPFQDLPIERNPLGASLSGPPAQLYRDVGVTRQEDDVHRVTA